jgi:hypothetical protein
MSNNLLPPINENKHKLKLRPFHRFFISNQLITIIILTLLTNIRIFEIVIDTPYGMDVGAFFGIYYVATLFLTPFLFLFYIKESEHKKYGAYMLIIGIVISLFQALLLFFMCYVLMITIAIEHPRQE